MGYKAKSIVDNWIVEGLTEGQVEEILHRHGHSSDFGLWFGYDDDTGIASMWHTDSNYYEDETYAALNDLAPHSRPGSHLIFVGEEDSTWAIALREGLPTGVGVTMTIDQPEPETPWVLIQGGLVHDSSGVDVIDLDTLEYDTAVVDWQEIRDLAVKHGLSADWVAEIDKRKPSPLE